MAAELTLGTIRTNVPERLDRLPWSRFHWRVVIGLGTVWILDGLEVTIVGAIAARLIEPEARLGLSAAGIGIAAAIYVTGACLGALFFGQLTDRFGRKKMMLITLGVYIIATVATAFAFAPWYFYVCRFVTGMGIGGEYAAINSAIDELIPARARGQVDITINGSYWVGSAIGAVAALLFLNTNIFPAALGWRLAFAAGAILGLGILLVRRHVPESPRWLFIHGREEEAERIVNSIEEEVREETTAPLPEPEGSMLVRQRHVIPFREIARVAVRLYPKRAVLGLALFVGQAFLYNAVTFDLGTILSGFFEVTSSAVPYFIAIFAAGNFLGPLLLGRLFDTVGRIQMITATYVLASVLTGLLALLLVNESLNRWSFILLVGVTFFFASAGASSAYLTVSEIFPMETRALAIAFFYAVGTATGGIIGPLLFGAFIESGRISLVALGFLIGAVIMLLGGIAELIFGVRAERTQLENIARPLTVADAEEEAELEGAAAGDADVVTREQRASVVARRRAAEARARAGEHRAAAHELQAAADRGDSEAARRIEAEQVLAQVSELQAEALEAESDAHLERAEAERTDDPRKRDAALARAEAAMRRSEVSQERAEVLSAATERDAEFHTRLAEAAAERARAQEQRALAAQTLSEAEGATGREREVFELRAEVHEAWAAMHEELAKVHVARAHGATADAERFQANVDELRRRALAAEERTQSAEHRAAAVAMEREEGVLERTAAEREEAVRHEQEARERERRIRERIARRSERERHGLRRFLPGPGSTLYSPGMVGIARDVQLTAAELDLDREIEAIARAVNERGPTSRYELANMVGARFWGPGRFRLALREAEADGRVRRLSRDTYGPPEPSGTESGESAR